MDSKSLLSLSSIKDAYKTIASPPEKQETEHPYDFIIEAYGFHSIAARTTNLPGFSPPSYVSFAYLFHKLWTIFFAFSVVSVGVTLIAAGITAITNIQFTFSIPFTGWVLYEFKTGFTLVVTPVFLLIISFWGGSIGFVWSKQLARKLSKPYESEYEEWLDELKPPNLGYPSGLAEVYFTDEAASKREELQTENIPRAAPPAFREPTKYEKSIYMTVTAVYIFLWFFLHPFRVQTETMYTQAETITDEVTPSPEVQTRREKYS